MMDHEFYPFNGIPFWINVTKQMEGTPYGLSLIGILPDLDPGVFGV